MENHLKKMYSQAKRDVCREWYKYMESIKPEADELLKAYEDAKLTGDKDLIKETGKEYGQFLRQQTYMNKRYKSMLDTITTKLANVNEIALSYLNDEMPKVYVINYNQLSKDMPAGISFSLVDETTVKNLVKDNPKLLPNKKLDIPKDKRWNQKAINAQVLQSIIQGESIPEMAKRLTPIMDRNKKSAIRNARTMTTSAQNKGRLDSYEAAKDNGVVLHKVWMATNSERTRAWHAALNGVEVDIDKPFENDYGKIMFPGDPDADPGNVYNCRCTLTTKIIGFKREDGSIKYIEGEESTSEVNTKSEAKAEPKITTAAVKASNKKISADKEQLYYELIDDLDKQKITKIPVSVLDSPLREPAIVEKIAGPDKTQGSCVSLALAYCANKAGLDVIDYRGGKSQAFFSTIANHLKAFKLANAKIDSYEVKKEVSETAEILKSSLEANNKQYCLSAGQHIAIVRKDSSDRLWYLELQDEEDENGWICIGISDKRLETVLKDRFGCRKSATKNRLTGKTETHSVHLIEVDSFEANDQVKDVLSYINTAADKQKKGSGGGLK